jgi:leucyl/phenylalanyl-tRNA---protein transferase
MRLPPSHFFPPAHTAPESGLISIGGRLTPEWLLDAYSHGIFPWPFTDGQLAWWSPDPRAVLELDDFRVSRSLERTCRRGKFHVTCDRDFAGVVEGCATAQDRGWQTWLTAEMRQAYVRLHQLGHAHSIEVWHDGELAGGTYGLALGGLFAAESMFYRVTDASKIALIYLVDHLRARGFTLLDIQQLTGHTERLGAREIPRRVYLGRLAQALDLPIRFGAALEASGKWPWLAVTPEPGTYRSLKSPPGAEGCK